MVKFKPGDRVRYTDDLCYSNIRKGEGGTVDDPAYNHFMRPPPENRLLNVRFDDHPFTVRKLYEWRVSKETGPW